MVGVGKQDMVESFSGSPKMSALKGRILSLKISVKDKNQSRKIMYKRKRIFHQHHMFCG